MFRWQRFLEWLALFPANSIIRGFLPEPAPDLIRGSIVKQTPEQAAEWILGTSPRKTSVGGRAALPSPPSFPRPRYCAGITAGTQASVLMKKLARP